MPINTYDLKAFLDAFKERGTLTIRDLEIYGIKKWRAKRVLDELVSLELVERIKCPGNLWTSNLNHTRWAYRVSSNSTRSGYIGGK